MENQQCQCDNCKELIPIVLKERKHPRGIIESYIKCPHCKEEYIASVTDPKVRREQEEVRKLHEKYMKRKGKLTIHMEQLKVELLSKRSDK
ncbi:MULTISPECIES: hypothetical protein [unclassified Lysinibacillus]|uniref:hypothetical protein n=1 Tax=unclassified Lysinibacillus TaxID=2636778 RepID=UPI0037F90E47